MKIKFNHEADSLLEVIGSKITQDELAEKIGQISIDFLTGDKGKISELCELVANNFTDEEILFICVQEINSTIEKSILEMALSRVMSEGDKPLS